MPERHRTDEQMRQRVLSYLYGALTAAEEEAFRAELPGNAELARLLQEEERLHHHLPIGGGLDLPVGGEPDLLKESRLLLRAALRREGRPAPSQAGRQTRWQVRWLDNLVPRFAWVAGALALFACGLSLGRAVGGQGDPTATALAAALVPGQLVDVRVQSLDNASGQVQLELSTLTTSTVEGHFEDHAIQTVLATALQSHLEPGPRLEAVALLGRQPAGSEARQALTHALLHDDNPGVRVAAAEALRGLAADEQIGRALQQALVQDANPGVRVAAIEGLRSLRDLHTRQALERTAHSEPNDYIRAEARRALEGWPTAAPTHL